MNCYAKFYEFISERLGQLSENSQLELINSITSCINYFGDSYATQLNREEALEEYRNSMAKFIESYKLMFKLSLKFQSYKNLKLFAERNQLVNDSEINFICKSYAKTTEIISRYSDLSIIYMKLIVSDAKKNANQLKIADTNSFTLLVHVFCRRFLKLPDCQDTITGLGLVLESISFIKQAMNPELMQKIGKMIDEISAFFRERPDCFEEMINQNLFHNTELIFFRSIKVESNLQLVKAFKNFIQKKLADGQVGTLFEMHNSGNLLDLYLKLVFGDFHDINSSDLAVANDCDLVQYEIFSKLAVRNLSDSNIGSLLKLCSKSYFIADTNQHSKFMNLVKLSLLSRNSNGLDELLRRYASSSFTVASLCFLSTFPFSLWKSSEKLNVKNTKY